MSKTTRIRQQIFTAPKAAENDDVHAAITLPASGITVVTTAITNPDVPRTIRLKGNQETTQELEVIVAGTDILDQEITETVTMGEAFATATDSTQAFKTVTSITVPTLGGASDTISVGLGLALDCCCNAYSFMGSYDVSGAYPYVHDADVISKISLTLDAKLSGTPSQVVTQSPKPFQLRATPRGLRCEHAG